MMMMETLFQIYHSMNDDKRFENGLCIFGSVLYFAIDAECRYLGMQLPMELTMDFQNSDIDIYHQLPKSMESEYTPPNLDFFKNLEPILSRVSEDLENITDSEMSLCDGKILIDIRESSSIFSREIKITFETSKGHMMDFNIYFGSDFEYETQIYDLQCMRMFRGENIIYSIASQLFPNRRSWRFVKDIDRKSDVDIYAEMKRLLSDEKSFRKYRQGFIRSQMLTHIFRQTMIADDFYTLQKVMLPKNILLSNLLFFLNGNLVRKLSPDISDRAHQMRVKIPRDTDTAKSEIVYDFLTLSLELWKRLDAKIFGDV